MMIKNQPKASSQIKIESHVTGKTLDVSLRVPEEELKQAWEQQRAMIAQRLAQLPQQIAAARSGKGLSAFAGPAQALAPAQAVHARPTPGKDSRIVNDEDGITVQLTLPGAR